MKRLRRLAALSTLALVVLAAAGVFSIWIWRYWHESRPVLTFNELAPPVFNGVPASVQQLDGKEVYIDGYIASPTDTEFQITTQYWSTYHSFNPRPPLPQQFVFATSNASLGPVAGQFVRVRGTLHAKVDRYSDGTIASIYRLSAAEILQIPVPAWAWLPTPVMFFGPAIAVLLLRVWLVQSSRPKKNATLCPVCGYDLRSSPNRCPECGSLIRRDPLSACPDFGHLGDLVAERREEPRADITAHG